MHNKKQNKTKQNKTKQNKTKQNKKQNKTKQNTSYILLSTRTVWNCPGYEYCKVIGVMSSILGLC